jgi:hypothetical protein
VSLISVYCGFYAAVVFISLSIGACNVFCMKVNGLNLASGGPWLLAPYLITAEGCSTSSEPRHFG